MRTFASRRDFGGVRRVSSKMSPERLMRTRPYNRPFGAKIKRFYALRRSSR